MKQTIAITVAALCLTGCVGYVPVQPTYYQSAPVYVQPRPVYIAPVPRCTWAARWNGYTRRYENVRVCR